MFLASVTGTVFLLRHFMAFGDSLETLDYAHFDELLSLCRLEGKKART